MPPAAGTTERPLTVALIGNPNTGKSTLFGALSGVRQRVGNYPGVTVEKKLGRLQHEGRRWDLLDLPGTYSLAPRSPDEMVAVDVLLGRLDDTAEPDAIVCVVDADNLERNLYLVSQVLELGRPTVIALTMVDVAEGRGLQVDVARLSRAVGVPVLAMKAHRKGGLAELKAAVAEAASNPPPENPRPFPEAFRDEVDALRAWIADEGKADGLEPPRRFLVERLLLDVGGYVETRLVKDRGLDPSGLAKVLAEARDRLRAAGLPVPAVEAMARYGWVGRVVEGVVVHPETPRRSAGDRIDAVLTHRVWGSIFLTGLLLLVFNAVFSWAVPLMDLIDAGVGALGEAARGSLPPGALRSLLVEGIVGGIGAVVIFLPQILILFFFLGILEDCGYLARAAFLMDRVMTRFGLSGKSCIPMLSSFACAIPGVMATRVIEDRRDRLTTILVAPLMSCSARLPVYALLIAAFIPAHRYRLIGLFGGFIGLQGVTMFAMYLVGIVAAGFVAFALRRTVFRGPTPPFVLELPAYKWPSVKVVAVRMLERGSEFLKRASTVILAVSIVTWAALHYPMLDPADPEAAPLVSERSAIAAKLADESDPEVRGSLETADAELEVRLDLLQKRRSYLGTAGRFIEPAVRPIGWDWRIGSAAIASFPAREVVVAALGVIFDVGEDVEEGEGANRLRGALRSATWPDGRPLFNIPVALSIMVFFALCMQCASTLAIMRRETGGWGWPAFAFVYMTGLAYLASMATYQVGMRIGG